MSVLSYREVVGRTYSHRFGESPSAERKFIVSLDSTSTSTGAIIGAVGVQHLDSHPEYVLLKCIEATATEGSPSAYYAEVVCKYEIPDPQQSDPNPLARPDVWAFSTGGATVPALVYYDGNTLKSLVNTAGDIIEGMSTEEAEVKATIQSNRATFPLALAASVTNCLNSDTYLGAAADTWKCQGISATQQSETVNNSQVDYWQCTVELVYRESGWPLRIPNTGWSVLEGGQKVRAYVKGPPPDFEFVASSEKVALDENGYPLPAGTPPAILYRRVHKRVAFTTFFGAPPF